MLCPLPLSLSLGDTTVVCGWMLHSFSCLPPALEPSNLLSVTAAPRVIYPAAAAAAALFGLNFLFDVCEAHLQCKVLIASQD